MRRWTPDEVLEMGRGYQAAAVLTGAADLGVFDCLSTRPRTAAEAAEWTKSDLRGMTILLDALAALELLEKRDGRYLLAAGVNDALVSDSPKTVLAMARHQANCLRRWAQLAHVVKSGHPAEAIPSLGGEQADQASFIGAMHNISAPIADEIIRAIQPLEFNHLLDLGGASGTWTMAFLRAWPKGRATLFDLPSVLPLAKQRLEAAGMANRVSLAGGDFLVDPLPREVDLAWVSAIVHQNSREQNRKLFTALFGALVPGGRIVIRDILMEDSRIEPVAGALFAVNMLVATQGGGTFTFGELREDLESVGFSAARVARHDQGMHSIVIACKS